MVSADTKCFPTVFSSCMVDSKLDGDDVQIYTYICTHNRVHNVFVYDYLLRWWHEVYGKAGPEITCNSSGYILWQMTHLCPVGPCATAAAFHHRFTNRWSTYQFWANCHHTIKGCWIRGQACRTVKSSLCHRPGLRRNIPSVCVRGLINKCWCHFQ